MRALLFAFSIVALVTTVQTTPASAADGCSWGPGGQLYCQPGARPGVPYYPGYHGRGHYQPRYASPGYYAPPPRHYHRRPKVRIYYD